MMAVLLARPKVINMGERMITQLSDIFLKNKIGLKIFLLFVLCALIPLAVISCVSYLYVSHQLKTEAHYRLTQQCKAIGFGVYERLEFLETELTSVAKKINRGQWTYTEPLSYDPVKREGNRFVSIMISGRDGGVTPVLGPVAQYVPPIDIKVLDHLRTGKSMLQIMDSQDSRPDIFMIQILKPDGASQKYLVAKIEPLYLWGIGAEGALPRNLEMVVCQPGQQILVSSLRDYELSRPLLEKFRQDSFSGIFESPHKGETYISSYWSLFLKHKYRVADWVVILSQSKSSILAPVSKFTATFFLLILLTFWVITLMAVHSIRKRMQPVEALKQGAEKFASGDLDHRVEIHSRDELEVLAQAFNNMGQKLKKSQAMVVQATKMSTFGQMAAGIVHEIGQPLTSISGYSDLLANELTEAHHVRFIRTVQREVKRLVDIISKFRTFSRTSTEVFKPVQMNKVIHQIHRLLEHQLKIKNIEIQLDLQQKLPDILGDRNGLQQVILNLAINAIDAMEEKGAEERLLDIRTFTVSDHLYVEIKDNGSGIPDHAMDSIFEPFFTTKSEEKGTGLGLAILQSIVHKHDAAIELTTKEDVGTCFSIAFPIAPPSRQADSEP